MISKLKNKLVNINQSVGLKARVIEKGLISFDFCVIEKQKNILKIVDQGLNLEWQEIENKIDPELPIALIIEGKGVLIRKLNKDEDDDNEKKLSRMIPGAKYDDFYMQNYYSESHIFSAIVRKQIVDDIVSQISTKFKIYQSSFGPFITQTILPFLIIDYSELVLQNHKLTLKDQKISDFFIKSEEEDRNQIIEVGDESVDNKLLDTYAASLSIFLGTDLEITHINNVQKEEWEYKRIFKKLGIGALSVFLFVLLINSYFYLTLNQKANDLRSEYNFYASDILQLENMKNEISYKRSFVGEFGLLRDSPFAFYADRLARATPSQISLAIMDIYPLDDKKLKDKKKEIFIPDLIHIEGSCSGPLILNNWLQNIEKVKWVSEIQNQEYMMMLTAWVNLDLILR